MTSITDLAITDDQIRDLRRLALRAYFNGVMSAMHTITLCGVALNSKPGIERDHARARCAEILREGSHG